ncbi:substrate-binding domain-containing protein [Kitasatospora sp. NPDC002040]|uniref:substrate-binding domain-containing protein n=1 Tax=Kitasatospora sp. NPDC002040 TaxID=3154661 RepID=UPI003326A27E
MDHPLALMSSMATRPILAELARHLAEDHGTRLDATAAGGVEIARRVRGGAGADLLVLAEDALADLAAEGHVRADTVRPLWISQVVAAVPAGAAIPVFGTEADLAAAVRTAGRIAYSTGPSGSALLGLLGRLDLLESVQDRLVQAPPGVPVGSLLASGAAELAFQQHSELLGLPGVRVLGPLPGASAISSVFAAGVLSSSGQPGRATHVLDLFGSDRASAIAGAHGMTAARGRP